MFTSNCQVSLFRCVPQTDGSDAQIEKGVFDAFFMEHYRTDKKGNREDHSEILLPPESAPEPGDAVEIKGLRRTIARVRHCTDAGGRVRCCRCTFLCL